MAKKITGYIKLQVPAGAANPSPPIGPALGQRGLNIMEFCKAFNARTAQLEKGAPIPVVITAYQDRSFTFEMRQPPVTSFFSVIKLRIVPCELCALVSTWESGGIAGLSLPSKSITNRGGFLSCAGAIRVDSTRSSLSA